MKKDDYLKALRSDFVFKEVLGRASSEAERRAIKAYTEDFILNFYNTIVDPLKTAMEKDPELLNKVFSEIESGLINSGSLDDNATAERQQHTSTVDDTGSGD